MHLANLKLWNGRSGFGYLSYLIVKNGSFPAFISLFSESRRRIFKPIFLAFFAIYFENRMFHSFFFQAPLFFLEISFQMFS